MKILIIATNETTQGLQEEVDAGTHPRVDYMELARILNTSYIDYNMLSPNHMLSWMERVSRIDIRLARQVNRLVERGGYDCVLSLSERVGLPLTRILDPGIRHVVIMHHPMSSMKLRMMRLMDVANRWNKIIAISYAEAEALKQALNLPDDLVTTLLTPVDTAFYDPTFTQINPAEQDHIQSLGLSHRDYPTLIRAMHTLPDIPCHLRVGSTWVNHKAGHENEDLPPNISIHPYVPPISLREAYARSRFIVVPIKDDTQWSAGCTSVQIGQAMGKAVIASDRPGLSNYIDDGENGILVRTGDAQDMSEAIDYLWRNPAKASHMGEHGRARQEACHSLDRWTDDIIKIVTKVAAIAFTAFTMIHEQADSVQAALENLPLA